MMPNYQLQPPAELIMGSPGSGKTDSLATLISAGLEVFVIVTEPDGVSSLIDSCIRRKVPIDKLHWSFCPPAAQGWQSLHELGEAIGTKSFEELKTISSVKGKETTRPPGMKLLNTFANFHCDRTNTDYGPVDKLNARCALVIDSLSGVNLISWMLSVGHKPSPHQGEWGVAMNFIEQLLLKISADRNCFLVVTAHMEREADEIKGNTVTTVSTLGRKLAPKITRFFSDIAMSKRTFDGKQARFLWSTLDATADLKNRNLPLSAEIEQDFAPVVHSYYKRLEAAGLSLPPDAPIEPRRSEPVKAAPPLQPTLAKR
jgi:hypothetical protein